MKKFLTLLFWALLTMQSVFAQTVWTVKTIPNTRLQSNQIHVSDPDGIISNDTEMAINTALCAIRDNVDVFIVTVKSIGDEVPQQFRTDLFNYWGIGDKGKDNGLLMLFVEDQHAMEFETGYGIEPILPDAKCYEIFNHTMKPYFKNGDYDRGMYAGVLDIVEVFGGTVPDGVVTVLPDEQVYKDAAPVKEETKETEGGFYMLMWLILIGLFPTVSALAYLYIKVKDKKNPPKPIKDEYTIREENGLKYIDDFKTTWSGSPWHGIGCMRSLTFGFSGIVWLLVCSRVMTLLIEDPVLATNAAGVLAIVTYLSWVCWRNNVRTLKMAEKVAKDSLNPKMVYDKARNHPRTAMLNYLAYWVGWYYIKQYKMLKEQSVGMMCPECHQPMAEGGEVQLNAIETAEKEHNVWTYTSLRCPSGHAYVVKEKGKSYDLYFTCEKCGAHLKKNIKSVVLTKATYSHSGLKEVTYECQYCHDKYSKQFVIPKLERSSSSSSSSSSRSSGGSFGGGRSGGGGYSGKW